MGSWPGTRLGSAPSPEKLTGGVGGMKPNPRDLKTQTDTTTIHIIFTPVTISTTVI